MPAFEARLKDFEAANAQVMGISTASIFSPDDPPDPSDTRPRADRLPEEGGRQHHSHHRLDVHEDGRLARPHRPHALVPPDVGHRAEERPVEHPGPGRRPPTTPPPAPEPPPPSHWIGRRRSPR